MIRKWLKFNASFIEILKNSTSSKSNREQEKCSLTGSLCRFPRDSGPGSGQTHGPISPLVRASINWPIKFRFPDPKEMGDGRNGSDLSEEGRFAVARVANVARTQFFEISGPKGSAFLVEVDSRDSEEVRGQLNRLRGDFFRFEEGIAQSFSIECLLLAEPLPRAKKDQIRLAKIHAISSGSEVCESDEPGRFLFVNSAERATRVKRMLEKFQYKINGILFRFQPSRKARLKHHLLEICREFVNSVENLPKVVSVTHNL